MATFIWFLVGWARWFWRSAYITLYSHRLIADGVITDFLASTICKLWNSMHDFELHFVPVSWGFIFSTVRCTWALHMLQRRAKPAVKEPRHKILWMDSFSRREHWNPTLKQTLLSCVFWSFRSVQSTDLNHQKHKMTRAYTTFTCTFFLDI